MDTIATLAFPLAVIGGLVVIYGGYMFDRAGDMHDIGE